MTRITLITTGLQLIAELPPIPVFLYATIFGPAVTNEPAICVWNTIGGHIYWKFFWNNSTTSLIFSRLPWSMQRFALFLCVPCFFRQVSWNGENVSFQNFKIIWANKTAFNRMVGKVCFSEYSVFFWNLRSWGINCMLSNRVWNQKKKEADFWFIRKAVKLD